MPAPVFPSTAILLMQGLARRREPNVRRTEMESGPAKQAPKASRTTVTDSHTYGFESKANYLAFIDWFGADLADGSKWFMWPDPVDGVTKLARIVGGAIDEEKPLNRAFTRWTVKLNIEHWS